MALFKVNTGLREREVVNLRWEWETHIPELETSIFVIPRDYVKNALDRYVVLNRNARSVIESAGGRHREFVFTCEGKPVTRTVLAWTANFTSFWRGHFPRSSTFGRQTP